MAKRKVKARQPNHLMRVVVGLFILTIMSFIGLLVFTLIYLTDLGASRKEYAALSKAAAESREESTGADDFDGFNSFDAFDAQMRKTNPDYLCWLNIAETSIDYPVVRGSDNEKYLEVSFSGEKNAYGAVFMDYRCVGDYVPHIIIYAHNAKTGDMFGSLRKFLEPSYLAEHSIITLAVNGRAVEYKIFAARRTDTRDLAYCLDFDMPDSFTAFAEKCGAPNGTAQIITLSTCVSGDDKDERVIVQGALIVDNILEPVSEP